MRRILLLITIWSLLIASTSPAEAYELLIVQSQRSPVYDEVMRGIRSVRKFSERIVVLSDYSDVDIKRIVREDRPAAVVTLGDLALQSVRKVTQIPVIPLMAVSYRQNADDQLNGIEVLISPERYISIFRQLKADRVGVIYSRKTSVYVRRAQKAAAKAGIELIVKEIASSKDVFTQLSSLKGNVDTLWMLPDAEVVSPLTMEGFANFSMGQNVPIVTYASAFLSHGAAIAVEIDRTDLGRQAGEMIISLLDGEEPSTSSSPRKVVIKFNHTLLKRLGISSDTANRLQQNLE